MIQKLTGVSATISAAHTSPTGVTHGHTWSVVAWFVADKDAVFLSGALNGMTKIYDHGILPPELSRGEDMAAHILQELAPIGCFEVEVSRPLEGIFAKAQRLEINK